MVTVGVYVFEMHPESAIDTPFAYKISLSFCMYALNETFMLPPPTKSLVTSYVTSYPSSPPEELRFREQNPPGKGVPDGVTVGVGVGGGKLVVGVGVTVGVGVSVMVGLGVGVGEAGISTANGLHTH
jgi:hypothetical protein